MFGFGEKQFIGIDVGTSSVKIVELKMSGNKPILVNYAWMPIDNLLDDRGIKESYFEVALPEYLKRMIKEGHFSSREAIFSIPAFGGLITLIEFPNIEKSELDQAIRFEARKYIPMSLDDVILSWDVVKKDVSTRLLNRKDAGEEKKLEEKEKGVGENRLEVLLVAAPKNKVAKYEQLAIDAKLKLNAIEIESFSLVRSLIGNDQGNFVIVDIGSRICNIILVEKGVIKANRNMDAGGRDITKVIARSINVDNERAEKLKVSDNNFLSAESNVKFPVIDLIIGEVVRVIKAYYKDGDEAALDGIILSGGTARFSGLDEYFSKTLNIKTIIGNPLSRVDYDKRLQPQTAELGSYFSVAIGLALSGFDKYLKK
ncbi:MAG: pilus assembly protein PilM [Parcubacteria group bacterium]|jgi:type IV pilus assembly protein PilM